MAEGYRLRVCYTKSGRLRHLSHLETVHAFERAARRAGLPYAVSRGFSPRMRIAFGPALPVGTAGEREYLDLMLVRFVPPDEACAALRRVVVAELAPCACGYTPAGEASLAAALTIAEYVVTVKGGIPREEIERSLDAIVRNGTLTFEHKGKTKVFDLAEALPKEPEVVSTEGTDVIVRMVVRMGQHGSLRPDVLVTAALGHDARMLVTRTDLLIEDGEAWRRPL
ncbi:MAG TPA: TIGR03936 family radical SAM-associated protein [Coriobacteriia bacterium]|nr:TIGR03936 family radical SAM-associated protein [Coriobacteriia bacterium]